MNHFHFAVDQEYAKQHNELLRDTRRLTIASLLFAAMLAGLGVLSMSLFGEGLGLGIAVVFFLMAAVFVVIAPIIGKKVGTAQELYDRYELAPAIVAEVLPRSLVLLALVNVSAVPSAPPRWGLAIRNITRLEGHPREEGARVPSVAVTGRRSMASTETWDEISPMPIAWATTDAKVIDAAARQIPPEQWDMLAQLKDKLPEVQATRLNLLPLEPKRS